MKTNNSNHTWKNWLRGIFYSRDVVSVSTSRSRDGLEMHFPNVSVSSRSRRNVGTSWSRLGLKVKHLGLVSVLGLRVSFTSDIFLIIERKLNDIFAFKFSSIVTQFPFKVLESSKPLTNNNTNKCVLIFHLLLGLKLY